MTTLRKLWLGFGILTALVMLSGVAILVRVQSIEGRVGEMASSRDLSTATRQLEINVLDYALAVQAHFQRDDTKPRQDAANEAADVEQHLQEYERLATADRQQEMAARFVPMWQELKKLGQTLLNAENRQLTPEESKLFYDLRTGLENLLDAEMQVDAIATDNARRDAAVQEVQSVVEFVLLLLIVGVAVAVVTSGAVGRGVVKAEERLDDARQLLHVTLASIGDAVITTDTEGRIAYLNAAAESATGWKHDEAARQPLDVVFRIINEQTRQPVVTRALREGVIAGVANHAVLLIMKDGTERPVDESAAPIQDEHGNVAGWVLSFRDVSEKRRAQEALREGERRLRFVMESAPQKIFTAKPNGDVHYFNPQWTEFTGLSFEQIRDWGWTQFIHPDDVKENVRVWKHCIDTGERFDFEHRFRRADGEYRWHVSRAVPLRNAEGKVMMWVGSNTDIHEQKQTADRLRQLAADLSEADRRRNEFLAMLAHELRNPLAPIQNALQVMRLTEGNGEAVRSASEMMERQVDQMVRLVDDLLDVSRMSRGKIELRRGRIELASVMNRALEAIRPLCNSMNHELTVTLPMQPVYLNGDPTRLAQIVGNLLSNACTFTERGGHIGLTVEREGGQAVIRVRDTGIGIAADQLPRIFEMFMQVDSSIERMQSGLGIGLTLVRELVEMHGGTVDARSAGIGQGSEFVLRLPILVEIPEATPPEPTLSESTSATARRILVVDDNRDSAASLATLLKLTGNETHTAYDGLEAVEAAATIRPDVVLLDIGLPKLNGYEAARRIREQPWSKGVMLVALTGWGQEEDRRKSRNAGFDHHMVKPVDYAALMKVLASLPSEQGGQLIG